MKIVLVDDRGISKKYLLGLLERMGHCCKTASNIEELLAIIKNWNADLVVTDYAMPDNNGIGILKTLRYEYPKTKVVILTAFAYLDNQAIALNIGPYGFFRKEMDISKLTATIKQIEQKQFVGRER